MNAVGKFKKKQKNNEWKIERKLANRNHGIREGAFPQTGNLPGTPIQIIIKHNKTPTADPHLSLLSAHHSTVCLTR